VGECVRSYCELHNIRPSFILFLLFSGSIFNRKLGDYYAIRSILRAEPKQQQLLPTTDY
jgi:hypothetical protein